MPTTATVTLKTKPTTVVVAGKKKGPVVVLTPKSKACPFCGDTRHPNTEEKKLEFEVGSLFHAECQCCGAQGPMAITRGAAMIQWDERRAPGKTEGFVALSDRLAGHNPSARFAPRFVFTRAFIYGRRCWRVSRLYDMGIKQLGFVRREWTRNHQGWIIVGNSAAKFKTRSAAAAWLNS